MRLSILFKMCYYFYNPQLYLNVEPNPKPNLRSERIEKCKIKKIENNIGGGQKAKITVTFLKNNVYCGEKSRTPTTVYLEFKMSARLFGTPIAGSC